MASLKYLIKGNRKPSTIYLRFKQGGKFDLTKSTSLVIKPTYWNDNKGSVKQLSKFKDKINLQNKLNGLSNHILNKFNDVYSTGGIISSEWLETSIKEFFNQNSNQDFNYFLDYAKYFKETLNSKVQNNGNTGVKNNTLKRYNTIINKVQAFEKHQRKRYNFEMLNNKFYKDFKHFLIEVEKLNLNTTGRYLNYIKTICHDARKYGIKVNPFVFDNDFRATKEPVNFITLTENEIDLIFKHDFSKTPYLDNARNWLIVGVWTGARVSDLLQFKTENIKNGFIEYTAKKTDQKIVLPLHPQVKNIVNKLNGQLPKPISSQRFNDYIKTVCEEVEINAMVSGAKRTKLETKVWRKTPGEYKKHELVSSHICRRSFATNHYGKLPTPVIMAVTGHKTEKMFLNYIGKTAKDNANVLNEFWKVQELKKGKKQKLKIVKNQTA